jgi:hypothetical protein
METQYLSTSDQAQFSTIVHEGGELADLFAQLMVQMDVDTDYSSVMVSCLDEMTIRISVDDSPYYIIMDEREQEISLYTEGEYGDEGDRLDGPFDFDEDGIEMVVDIMACRVLTDEAYVTYDDDDE